MPPGDDRELLRLAGVIRQRSCSLTAVKVSILLTELEGIVAAAMVVVLTDALSVLSQGLKTYAVERAFCGLLNSCTDFTRK